MTVAQLFPLEKHSDIAVSLRRDKRLSPPAVDTKLIEGFTGSPWLPERGATGYSLPPVALTGSSIRRGVEGLNVLCAITCMTQVFSDITAIDSTLLYSQPPSDDEYDSTTPENDRCSFVQNEDAVAYARQKNLSSGMIWLLAKAPAFFPGADLEIDIFPQEEGEEGSLVLRVWSPFSSKDFRACVRNFGAAAVRAGHRDLYMILGVFQRRSQSYGRQIVSGDSTVSITATTTE